MNDPAKKNNKNMADEQVERLVYDALRLSGHLPPTTVEEVARLEAEVGEYPTSLPGSLGDPLALLRKRSTASVPKVIPFPPRTNAQENLARAARDGGEIAPDVEGTMKQDRDAAEGDLENEA